MVLEEGAKQLLPTSVKIIQFFGNQQGSICTSQPLDVDTPMKETQGLVFQECTALWETKGPGMG